jgi:hypothetical protein
MTFFRLNIAAVALLLAAPALAQGVNPQLKPGSLAPSAAAANLGFVPLNPANNLSELTSQPAARANLGLGALATQETLGAGGVTSSMLATGAAAANIGAGGATSSMLASGAAASNLSADGPIYFAKSYGPCAWTSAGDVGPCINLAIAAAAAAGGGQVLVPAGLYGLSTPIVQQTSGVSLKGQGVGDARSNLSPGSFRATTRLLWIGSAGATMYDEEPASGGVNTLSSASVEGIVFDCNNSAAVCAKISQVSHSRIDIGVAEPTSIGVWLTTNTGSDSPGTQDNDIWIASRQTSTTATATGIMIDGGTGSWNVSYNRLHRLYAWYGAGDGVVFGNSDNNLIEDIRSFKQPGVSVYGRSCIFANTGYTSPNTIATNGYARASVVKHNGCNDMKVAGPTNTGFAHTITVQFSDNDNAVPNPVFDTYSTGYFGRTNMPLLQTGAVGSQVIANMGNNASVGNGGMAFGASNSISGTYAIGIGSGNIVSNWFGAAIGQNHQINGFYSQGRGQNAVDRGRYGADCWASGKFVSNGDAEGCKTVLRGTGSSTSAVSLTADGAARGGSNCINIPTNAAYSLRVTVQAFDHTTPANAETWQNWGMMLTRGSGNAALVTAATPTPLTTGTVTGSAIAASADTTNQCLILNFTPPTSNTDTWNVVATVESVEAQ